MTLPTIEELVNKDLFELLGIEKASDEIKQKILEKMMTTVDARVVNRVAELLSEEDAKHFHQLSEQNDPQRIIDFLVSKEIDLPQIVTQEATRHRTEIVQMMGLVQEK